jgi:hypothetical protein
MEEIVIISDNNGQENQLAVLLRDFFPECKVTVVSREDEKAKRIAGEGEQYAENAERR